MSNKRFVCYKGLLLIVFYQLSMLTDQFHRIHDYLRISLTDTCNFRCTYCMPNEEISVLPHKKLMQVGEIEQIAKVFVTLGVTKIRLTGGEPLVRKDAKEIIEKVSQLPVTLTLTTNGVLLHKYLDTLQNAHIHSLNVSIDSLQAAKFQRITQRNSFQQVWDNILLLVKNNFHIKINVVVMRGINDDEIIDFIALTQALPLHVRFIEFMPFEGNAWEKNNVFTTQEMLALIQAVYPIEKLIDAKHATTKAYKVPDYQGTFAFITTMSQPFCSDCNRLRITADGKMKNCLFGKDEIDILGALRKGEDIVPLIYQSVGLKHGMMGGQFGTSYQETDANLLENRSMIKIGG